jgi:glucokinase
MAFSIGIDIGGSHVSGGIVDNIKGALIMDSYSEMPIDPLGPKDEILTVWTSFIQGLLEKHADKNIQHIGFAMPGPFDYKNGIAQFEGVPKYTSLKGVDIGKHLKETLPGGNNLSIKFMNDATAFALGEYNSGAAENIKRVWILTLGTGFGSTFLSEGTPLLSGPGMPEGGYLWNQTYENGIADEFFSTRWFENTWKARTDQTITKVKPIAELVDHGNEEAIKLFRDFAGNLACFLTPWLRATQSEGVVIGGGIAKAWKYFGDQLETNLKKADLNVSIKPGALGKYAPIVGAVS